MAHADVHHLRFTAVYTVDGTCYIAHIGKRRTEKNGDVIRNVPHLKMHLLYKTKEDNKETLRTSLFAGIKYVQPRRQRSVLYFVFVFCLLSVVVFFVCVFGLPAMMQFIYEYIKAYVENI